MTIDPGKFPELHHYTTPAGLAGITSSNTLWATNYRYLNDWTELQISRTHLVNYLTPLVHSELKKRRKISPKADKEITRNCGIVRHSNNISNQIYEAFHAITFGGTDDKFFANPYISSLCNHNGEKFSYERENGLLSQWRAYARDGFCIVFDTEGILHLCHEYTEIYATSFTDVLEVSYDGLPDSQKSGVESAARSMGMLFSEREKMEKSGLFAAYDPIAAAAVSLKHQAFREECEIRIAVSPLSRYFYERQKSEDGKFSKTFISTLNPGKPTIPLFKECQRLLPIKRVIVGPSTRQDSNYQTAVDISSGRWEVTRSETPLVEQASF